MLSLKGTKIMKTNDQLASFIVNRIKELRNKHQLTQEQLSLKAGLDPKYINKLENGRFGLRIETLTKILDTLEISYLDFFEFSNSKNSDNINELISKLSTLSIEEQELKVAAILQLLK